MPFSPLVGEEEGGWGGVELPCKTKKGQWKLEIVILKDIEFSHIK